MSEPNLASIKKRNISKAFKPFPELKEDVPLVVLLDSKHSDY